MYYIFLFIFFLDTNPLEGAFQKNKKIHPTRKQTDTKTPEASPNKKTYPYLSWICGKKTQEKMVNQALHLEAQQLKAKEKAGSYLSLICGQKAQEEAMKQALRLETITQSSENEELFNQSDFLTLEKQVKKNKRYTETTRQSHTERITNYEDAPNHNICNNSHEYDQYCPYYIVFKF